jgi:hypothetical protein
MDSPVAVQTTPRAATILAEGELSWIPVVGISWLTDENEIAVAVAGDVAQAGRRFLVRLQRRDGGMLCRTARLRAQGDYAVASAVIGQWDGEEYTALTLYPVIEPGEES